MPILYTILVSSDTYYNHKQRMLRKYIYRNLPILKHLQDIGIILHFSVPLKQVCIKINYAIILAQDIVLCQLL